MYFIMFVYFKDDILKMIQSNTHIVIQKYIEDYLILLRNKINQYRAELTKQSASCPLPLSPLEIIDQRLKEFVRSHHIDLIRTINYQVNKVKDNIYEKQLFKQLSCYYLTTEQIVMISQLFRIVFCFYSLV
jgi:hypothetical protein